MAMPWLAAEPTAGVSSTVTRRAKTRLSRWTIIRRFLAETGGGCTGALVKPGGGGQHRRDDERSRDREAAEEVSSTPTPSRSRLGSVHWIPNHADTHPQGE